jgi:hypothetical protein
VATVRFLPELFQGKISRRLAAASEQIKCFTFYCCHFQKLDRKRCKQETDKTLGNVPVFLYWWLDASTIETAC